MRWQAGIGREWSPAGQDLSRRSTPEVAAGGGAQQTGHRRVPRDSERTVLAFGLPERMHPLSWGRTVRPPPARATRPRGIDAWLDAPRGGNDLGRSAVRRIHRPRTGHVLVAAPAGYFAAFFLRSAQEAVIRSETAFFSSAVIGRRFLVGLASDAVSATGVAAAAGRREEERRAAGFAGAEVTSILSTSFNAWISPCKRSISLWRSAIAFAMTLISFPRGCIVRRSTRSGLRLRARSNGLRF